ncbi:Uncharacterised protein [uncultured archaeon]|nr:Uncharacterised protein [uncultured archaeon]
MVEVDWKKLIIEIVLIAGILLVAASYFSGSPSQPVQPAGVNPSVHGTPIVHINQPNQPGATPVPPPSIAKVQPTPQYISQPTAQATSTPPIPANMPFIISKIKKDKNITETINSSTGLVTIKVVE